MNRPILSIALLLVAAAVTNKAARTAEPGTAPSEAVSTFHTILRLHAVAADQRKRSVIPGTDGWLFFAPEFRSLTVGPFWSDHAQKVSRANNKRYADPLEPIVDFHRQLNSAGIRLLVVPVPAKVAVYPEQLDKNTVFESTRTNTRAVPPRIDIHHQAFHKLLASRGVEVIDLMPVFLARRHDRLGPLYCKTDTHWSGRGVAVAAATILKTLKEPAWLRGLSRTNSATMTRPVSITGDLARMLAPDNPDRESLPLTFLGKPNKGGRPIPIPIARNSPVLITGDSHTLVFHDPALHATGAGLPDHIAAGLGIPVDLVGVRGSGATATRISLLRRRDNLEGKKLVIWCFSIREYTESFSGWRKVPVIRR